MAAYKLLVEQKKFDIEPAICISGLGNQSSFSKRFKQLFNMSPKEAHIKKDKTIYVPPLTWDSLSSESTNKTLVQEEEKREHVFGVSKEQYDLIVEYQECQALFDFDDVQSEVAYRFIETSNLPVKVAFEITNKISEEYYYYGTQEKPMSVEDLETFMPDKDEVILLYENATQDVNVILDLINDSEGQLFDVAVTYISWYFESYSNNWDFGEYLGLVKDFVKYNGDDLDEYFEYIECGYSPEGAAFFSKDHEDDLNDNRLEVTRNWIRENRDDHLERLVKEETEYYDDVVEDYDPDNPYYSDDGDEEDMF